MDENSIALKQFISESKCLINYLNTMLLIFQRLITETLRKLITWVTSRQSLLNVEVKVTPMKQFVSSEVWSEGNSREQTEHLWKLLVETQCKANEDRVININTFEDLLVIVNTLIQFLWENWSWYLDLYIQKQNIRVVLDMRWLVMYTNRDFGR